MDNKIVSTTYVPLQPPYQIIKYGKDIGMQIGTLIATSQLEGDKDQPFKVETHSYPVVTYGSKERVPKDKHLFGKVFMEGVVWNRVELRDVSTICLSDSHLEWQEFVDFLWEDIARTSQRAEPHIDSLRDLLDLGVEIAPLPQNKHILHIQSYCGDWEQDFELRSDRDDILALNTVYRPCVEEMADILLGQVWKYKMIMMLSGKYKKRWELEYTTDEEFLQPIVDEMNKRSKRNFGVTPDGALGLISDDESKEE